MDENTVKFMEKLKELLEVARKKDNVHFTASVEFNSICESRILKKTKVVLVFC